MNLGDLHQVWEIKEWSDQLGIWAMPVYVGLHTIALALCLPSAVFFEACPSMLFGFLPTVFCVFTAKILGASLSFWIGRLDVSNNMLPLIKEKIEWASQMCKSPEDHQKDVKNRIEQAKEAFHANVGGSFLFFEKMRSQQKLQDQQLEMLKHMRKFHLEDLSAILEKLHKQMQGADFEGNASVLSAEQIQEIVRRRVSPVFMSS